ncbi:dTDP-4-dehydrorhamnose 3,5-epimerase family protein [Pelagimonas phthalicica]|nr:dTDP-4-dehydrorhamnose 3,5-epimerase family protein [Pelagimonas phthalicica]
MAILYNDVFEDNRGFFTESYRADWIEEALGRPYRFAQGNHSRSSAGTLRGFRMEPWDKLVTVAHGTAMIVVVDPRPDSPTFRQHWSGLIGDEPGKRARVVISKGLANAFYCLTEVDYINEVSETFVSQVRKGFAWNDPGLAINWPTETPTLSEADSNLPSLDALLASAG